MKQQNLIVVAIALIATMSIFTACDGGSFTDPRDGQTYKTVKIGDQVWMAENLKYERSADRVRKTGASYTWDSALVACPDGWRLPNKEELESIATDTSFNETWSSTEKEDFTYYAYGKDGVISSYDKRNHDLNVRCVQGIGEKQQRLQEVNGYKAVRVGEQIWMADNLDIKTPNSICYLDDENECSSGRFYPFSEAINVCPEGWRLPSKSEAAKFLNKLNKESIILESTHGYYDSKKETFDNGWGRAMLWTSTYGYVMRRGYAQEIWEHYRIKEDNWKIAVRCIADAEVKE